MRVFVAIVLSTVSVCAVANDAAQPRESIPHQQVLTEIGGGSDSSVSPDGKFIAFSSRRNGNLDVYTVEIATGNVRQITTNPHTDNEPRWHPDSTHLIFVTMRDGSQDIYTVDLETLKETPIATKDFNEDYPSFSKDGSMACFTGGPRGFREVQIHVFATGKTRTLTRGYGYVGSTNFSPDGKNIVFHAYYDNSYASGKADVFIVPVKGGKPKNVTKNRDIWDYKPNWSFDGNWITLSRKDTTPNFNIYVMRPDGSDVDQVTWVDGPVPMRGGKISMSNQNVLDQRWSNWTRDGRVAWHQINAQSGQLNAVNEAGETVVLFKSEFAVNDVALSPDQSKLLFESDAFIYVMDAKPGAEPEKVASGLKPRWSRDGKSIGYVAGWPRRPNRYSLATGKSVTFDQDVGASWPPVSNDPWSPDGTKMATVQLNEDGSRLVVVSQNGDEKVLVDAAASKTAPVWSADGKWLIYGENVPPSVTYCLSKAPLKTMDL
jgi:TolB protein